jgi:hypothetical protein
MKAVKIAGLCFVFGMMLFAARSSEAQGVPNFQPSTPTLSPWLHLYEKNPGPLDNYHMYVRPRMELRDTLQSQQSNINQQYLGMQSLNEEVRGLQPQEQVRPTGTASVFMNTTHYYPEMGVGQSPAQNAPRPKQGTWMPQPARTR